MKKLLMILTVLTLTLLTACGASAPETPEDGVYTIEVALEGGTGKASIDSPAELTVSEGAYTARIVWSSPFYDFMVVDGETLSPVNSEGNSVFEIPVPTLDEPLSVQADTTAMSQPHLIDYTLTFDPATLTEK